MNKIKYEIQYKEILKTTIEAESKNEAVNKFKEEHDDVEIIEIKEHKKDTAKAIFEEIDVMCHGEGFDYDKFRKIGDKYFGTAKQEQE